MRLYLDDDTASALLARLLRQAGHDVELPADAGLARKHDAAHLERAICKDRKVLSRNYFDFQCLHSLVLTAGGHHPGVLVVRSDNDPRDLSPKEFVKAINKLEASGFETKDDYIILNQWR